MKVKTKVGRPKIKDKKRNYTFMIETSVYNHVLTLYPKKDVDEMFQKKLKRLHKKISVYS